MEEMKILPPAANGTRLRDIYQRHQPAFHLALLLLCGLAAYSNSFRVPFYFDDFPCITQNPVVQHFSQLFELDRLRQLGLEEDIRNSLITRVVTYATFALNYRLHGYALPGYHLVNLTIHLVNALLVYKVVQVTASCNRRARGGDASYRDNHLALLVALIFVLHPVQTNAVTYITQRFTSLASLFCLTSLLSYVYAVLASEIWRRRLYYGLSLLALLLAMFSKEIAFTLPALIALYDIAFLPGEAHQRWRRLAPLAATMILLPLTVFRLAATSEITGGEVSHSLDLANLGGVSRWDYFFTQWRVIVTYLRLIFLPANLNLDYDYPLYGSPVEPVVLISGFLLVSLLILGFYLLFRPRQGDENGQGEWRLAGYGLVWFFFTLAMESSIIPLDDLIQEYRLYLPSFGLILAAVVAGNRLRRRLMLITPRLGSVMVVLAIVVVATLGITTFARNQVWQEELRFWQDAVTKSPDKARPHINLATAYLLRRQQSDAMMHARMASTGHGHSWITRYQLALLFHNLGDDQAAIGEMREAIRLAPGRALFHGVLGQLSVNTGDITTAVKEFQRALELDPGYTEARASLNELETLTPGAKGQH